MFNIGRGKPEREYKLEEFEAYIKLCIERDKMPKKTAEFAVQTALNSNNANLLWNFMTMNLFAEHTQNVSNCLDKIIFRKLRGYPEIKSLIYITPSYDIPDAYFKEIKFDSVTPEEARFFSKRENDAMLPVKMKRIYLAMYLFVYFSSIDGNGNYRKNFPENYRETPRGIITEFLIDTLIYCRHGDKELQTKLMNYINNYELNMLKSIVDYIDNLPEKEMMALYEICDNAHVNHVSQYKLPDLAKVMDKEAIEKFKLNCIDEFYEPFYKQLIYPTKSEAAIMKRYTERGEYYVTTTKNFRFSDWDNGRKM